MSGGDFQVVPHFAIDVGDDLIEEYSGFGLRFESRKLVTERLGVSFEWSTFDQTWRDRDAGGAPRVSAGAAALSQPHGGDPAREVRDHAAAHRGRRREHHRAGCARRVFLRLADGERRDRHVEIQPAMEAGRPASGTTSKRRSPCARARTRSRATSSTSATSGRPTTASDGTGIACSRRACSAASRARRRCSSGSRSAIHGRFAAGTSTTSRQPAAIGCSTRRWSTATGVLALFLDSGSVWDTGTDRKVRFSTGFGLTPGPAFFMVGFPLNTDEFRAVFTMGLRFSTVGVRHQQELTVAVRSHPATLVALTLFAWAAVNLGAQAVTVTRVADAVAVRAPAFTFIKGEPLVRLKDGRSVRVELDLAVLPTARRSRRGAQPAGVCSELRSLGRTICRHTRRNAAEIRGLPDVDGRGGLVSRTIDGAGRRARPAGRATCPSGSGSSTESWMARRRRIGTTTRALRCGD